MKLSSLSLAIILGAVTLAFSERTFANQNPLPTVTATPNRAATLVTQPATINSHWNNTTKPTANFTLDLINPECKKIDPLGYISDPEAFLQKCPAKNNQKRESSDPVEYLSVPRLDSGLKLNVTNF